ncbi:YggT family protein [Pseudactinotalea sp. HY158]|uniref:YggT family protein n=1 Tax=Pseudactinotalea sp. HY158 TaxID=2654547 RepID=UPI00129CC3A9|nr:YggT family protein [Pseudactinotalea sp. HY158]QGH69826.1 YggT family protein [Pseudactinotalea sp. HY158]
MQILLSVAYLVVLLFMITLFVRLVFDWIQVFARDWKPSGVVLIIAEGVYTVTDPPIKGLRRLIPPLRIGSIALDLAFLILLIGCSILLNILAGMAR